MTIKQQNEEKFKPGDVVEMSTPFVSDSLALWNRPVSQSRNHERADYGSWITGRLNKNQVGLVIACESRPDSRRSTFERWTCDLFVLASSGFGWVPLKYVKHAF